MKFSFAAMCFALVFVHSAFAQNEPISEVLQGAGDQYPIHITYYPVNQEAAAGTGGAQNAPVVVILHDSTESRLRWDKASAPPGVNPFPVELQNRGYAVVTVDLRKHGESVPPGEKEPRIFPNDYGLMVADLGVVKSFVYDQHQRQNLNMNKMGIIAVGMSVPISLAFAEADWRQFPYDDHAIPAMRTPRGQDVRVMVFLSPQTSAGRVHGARSASFVRAPEFGIAFQVVAGADDSKGIRDAESLYKILSATNKDSDRIEMVSPKLKDRGIELMRQRPQFVYVPVLKFLDDHLKTINSKWIDRRPNTDPSKPRS
ncbi:MAG: hypothetical protein KDA80_17110 [Planctomycetaceae bacterium]|nr:hypothetical protein [Planctomycetaceae bacterium]